MWPSSARATLALRPPWPAPGWGCATACFTINLDAVGNMPCNPAIGGTGKGHLVRELDALGGEMGRAADRACIQYRLLNRGKGPAVWSLRAQADRREYQKVMKHTLEQPGKPVGEAGRGDGHPHRRTARCPAWSLTPGRSTGSRRLWWPPGPIWGARTIMGEVAPGHRARRPGRRRPPDAVPDGSWA